MDLKKVTLMSKAAATGYFKAANGFKSAATLARLRDCALTTAVRRAYYETDFYREKYDRHGVRPDDIRTAADLEKLPIVTKQELIDNFEAAIPRNLDRRRAFLMGTSGSTGQPIQVYKDHHLVANFVSGMVRGMRMHEMFIPKMALIMDNLSPDNFEGSLEKYFKIIGGRFLPITVEQDIQSMLDKLEAFNPDYITAYTGVMRELATLITNMGFSRLNLRKVFVGGEMLDTYTRSRIETAFKCPCYDIYASTEGSFIAWECRHSNRHIKSDTVTVEIVDEDGFKVPDGEFGHILLTAHDGGKGTPIIRYSGCSDISCLLPHGCDCGVKTPLLGQIQGRVADAVILPDGRIYHAFCMTIPMEKLQRDHARNRIGSEKRKSL